MTVGKVIEIEAKKYEDAIDCLNHAHSFWKEVNVLPTST